MVATRYPGWVRTLNYWARFRYNQTWRWQHPSQDSLITPVALLRTCSASILDKKQYADQSIIGSRISTQSQDTESARSADGESLADPYSGHVYTGDGVARGEHGYSWIKGRVYGRLNALVQMLMNMYGYRFPTAEIKSALRLHGGVAEAATRGQSRQ
ncbi:hypothetical protein EDD15DRAFT_2201554 [Pisolithus albus]|nr:hypothetical protein EDD15DRAFT_2201554 [Pisolithus albus]